MTKLPIFTYPEPVLAQKAQPVAEITPEIAKLIEDMIQTMYESDGVGLAAPQVGHSIRLITLDETGPKERKSPMVLLNPEFVEQTGVKESEESCLSLPTFFCKVKRYETVTVRGMNEKGEAVEIQAEGLLAIILQHEIDHLEGKTLVDHASRLKRTMYDSKVKKWRKD
ncbi:MAG: peptide deformylase [Humidesulfovibrio sp.]|jgi:peptide deformylase|uniref:peptide deformylase n=1 Tax=Humidesulfovibrio sp. TaxID=2910988 RepID=UPI002735F8A6|nr:peptide deformylase [Humidesulfovibrio sp.]MDP2848406.1 peptide deformylase [Humidesulfovibrio sp.]